jgi:hypothetical protein
MRRRGANDFFSLFWLVVALLASQVTATSVTPPAAASAATVSVPAVPAASPTTTSSAVLVAPPSSPDLRIATVTNPEDSPHTEGPAAPEPTPLFGDIDGDDEINAAFVQTTYYSCVTRGTYSHCGWHIPILDASNAAPNHGGGAATGIAAIRAGLVAAAAAVAAVFLAVS